MPLSSTLLAGSKGLENAKRLVTEYKTGKLQHMTPELWHAKKIVDSTLHPGMKQRIRRWEYAEKKKKKTDFYIQTLENQFSCLSECPASSYRT